MSEEPIAPIGLPAPPHSPVMPLDTSYRQPPLFDAPRTDMPHLSDAEYAAHKASLGQVGAEHDLRITAEAVERDDLLKQLGMTASGQTLSARLFPEAMSRTDIDERGKPTWAQLSEINYLSHQLGGIKAASSLDTALSRLLTPIMKQGEINPNQIGEEFMGSSKKGRSDRTAAFGRAMGLLQHGTEEQRVAIIDDMEQRLALAKGVANAKQLILRDMPLRPGEEYGADAEPASGTKPRKRV